jgi:cobalt-zinc-cadmium efflux system protein
MSHHDHQHHDHAHHHHHHHHHAPASFGVAFAVGAALNIGFVAAQIGWGIAAGSMALLADAVHNAGDVLGLLLAWGAVWLAGRLPSRRSTYGWGRGSILAALLNSAVLLIGVGGIAVESVRRLADPAPVATQTVIWVGLLGIAVNGLTAWMFGRGRGGQRDLNIRATFLHFASDAAVSLGVVVAAVLIRLTGLFWLDPLASLLIAGVITVATWGVLREAAHLALDGVPPAIVPHDVEAYLRGLPGVVEVHDLHIWGLSTTETALTAHLVQSHSDSGEELIVRACRDLRDRYGIGHATLQLETEALASACRLRPADVV